MHRIRTQLNAVIHRSLLVGVCVCGGIFECIVYDWTYTLVCCLCKPQAHTPDIEKQCTSIRLLNVLRSFWQNAISHSRQAHLQDKGRSTAAEAFSCTSISERTTQFLPARGQRGKDGDDRTVHSAFGFTWIWNSPAVDLVWECAGMAL